MSSSPRAYIAEQLAGVIPAAFKLDPGIPTLKTLSQPLAWIEYTGFSPLPEAPTGGVAAQAALCMASNRNDLTAAQADIDELVWETYLAIVADTEFAGVTATKEVFEDAYLGWRITLTVTYSLTEAEE